MLSAAKHLLLPVEYKQKQILRSAQDDIVGRLFQQHPKCAPSSQTVISSVRYERHSVPYGLSPSAYRLLHSGFCLLISAYCLLPSAFCLLFFSTACAPPRGNRLVVGSKNFTEQVILGELVAQHLEARTGRPVERRFYLSGTYICHQAVLAGRIDLYVEYTGTALTAVLKEPAMGDPREVYNRVRQAYRSRFELEVTEPLGFNNTFAIVTRGEEARRMNLRTLSEAAAYAPHWRPGFGYEFMERPDGYQGLAKAYALKFAAPPRIMDLGLLYRALVEKQVDVVAGNSTDGLISALDLAVLQDDRHYFPPYEAVPIVRSDTLARHPAVRAALSELGGKISDDEMRRMNYALDGQRRDVKDVVQEFLRTKEIDTRRPSENPR